VRREHGLVKAYLPAKVESGKDEEVLKKVKKLPGICSAVPTYGHYDLHVEASFPTTEDLDEFIFQKLRTIEGIKETITLIAFKGK
jgi:DNA-binding Lrp family transcriptional regulator